MKTLKLFSGKCCLSDLGIPMLVRDQWGDPLHVHTGDIVQIYSKDYPQDEDCPWNDYHELTAVVSNQYTTYSNGTIQRNKQPVEPFVMGLKSVDFKDGKWAVRVLKKWADVVDGERWPAFGFSYQFVDDEHIAESWE